MQGEYSFCYEVQSHRHSAKPMIHWAVFISAALSSVFAVRPSEPQNLFRERERERERESSGTELFLSGIYLTVRATNTAVYWVSAAAAVSVDKV